MTDALDASRTSPLNGGASYPLKHRLLRAFWTLIWVGLGRWTPVPAHAWRRLLLSLFGANIDPKARVYPGVNVWYPPNLTMAARATLGPGVNCYCMAPITVESYGLVSQGAYLCAGTHNIDDPHFQLEAYPISIGAHAWVAADAFVGPGVSISEGAVLGARAVTVKNLDAWTVYAGNPARRIRERRQNSLTSS